MLEAAIAGATVLGAILGLVTLYNGRMARGIVLELLRAERGQQEGGRKAF